jgi:hypothetical protein
MEAPRAAHLVKKPIANNKANNSSNEVAATAKKGMTDFGAKELTSPVYAINFCQLLPLCHHPKRDATADKKLAAIARRSNKIAMFLCRVIVSILLVKISNAWTIIVVQFINYE